MALVHLHIKNCQPNFENDQRIYWHESVPSTRNSLIASSLTLLFSPAIAQYLQRSALFRLLSITGHSCRNLMPRKYEYLPQWEPNRSTVTMSLLYRIPAFEVAHKVFNRLTVVYWILLPYKPYRILQHYMRHVCGRPVLLNIDFLNISDFWAIVLSELYGYSTSMKTFIEKKCSFQRQVLIFQPRVDSSVSDKISRLCLEPY